MSNILIGVRKHDIPSQAVFEKMMRETMGAGESREVLFGRESVVMTEVSPRYDAGFFLCYEGVIRPRAFDGMVPSIVSQLDLLRGFSQDAMRLMLRDHGILVKIDSYEAPKVADGSSHDDCAIFFKISHEDVEESGVKAAYQAMVKWLSSSKIKKHAVMINGVMISPISRISKNMIRLHSAGGENDGLMTLTSKCPLYGANLKVEGMSDQFKEFWHLHFILAALGSRMEIKRASGEADYSLKMAVGMSNILAA